jgi:subtilisin family serine protease
MAAGALALLALLATSSADSGVLARQKPAARAAGGSQLMAFGGRSTEQRNSARADKLDAALADLSRHLGRMRSDHALEDLHSLSPAARFVQGTRSGGPLVAVDVATRGDPVRLKEDLIRLGMQHAAIFSNDVGGWLPVNQIGAAAALSRVAFIHASMPHARAAVTSQGDFAQRSDLMRANNTGLNGAGVTVGIISDSFNCYAVYEQPGSGVPSSGFKGYAPFGFATDDATFDEENGYLPASVNVLEEGGAFPPTIPICMNYGPQYFPPFADEGRAMMQIVHDVAPGAALAFYTGADSEADFANGIGVLAAAGATVIADDLGYYDEPIFQDGIVAQAVDAANAKGVAYFSAVGNNGQLSYETTTPSWTPVGARAGETALIFGTTSSQTSLPINLPTSSNGGLYPGEFIVLIVEWDDPYLTGGGPGASSQIDLCVSGTGTQAPDVVLSLDLQTETCTGLNALGVDPVQVLVLGNPVTNNAYSPKNQTVQLTIGLKNGSPPPGRIKVVVADDGAGSVIAAYDTKSPTLQGHPGAAGAAAVGASFFAQTPRCAVDAVAVLEPFSSAGGDPILFDTTGKRLAAPVVRQKPNFVGPDGVNTSFFGFALAGSGFNDTSSVTQCLNDASYNNFFGTSAATPHAAGVAALMREANPALTPAQIYSALQLTALPMGSPSPDYLSGYGFIQADTAMTSLPAGPPVLKLTPSTIYLSQSSTLTWFAVNSTSCAPSGSWNTPVATSGSQVLTPAAAGTFTYTLTCMSAAGSQNSSVNLMVQPVSPLGITSSSLPNGQVGTAYSAVLAATGGIPPYTWSIAGGTLPGGLSLNAATGTISGTPTAAVSGAALTVKVTDSEKTAQSKSTGLSLTIAAAPASGGGGGGGLDALTLLAMIMLGGARLLRASVRCMPGSARALRLRVRA